MRPAPFALGGAVALFLGALALSASRNPAAATGLAAAGGALASAVVLSFVAPMDKLRRRIDPPPVTEAGLLREWVRGGTLGHEEIVRLLDRVDRMGAHPSLSVRTEREMQLFRAMSRREFLAEVARRLDEIEGGT